MEQTLKPEALDNVDRKIGQLEMEARSLKPKVREAACGHLHLPALILMPVMLLKYPDRLQ